MHASFVGEYAEADAILTYKLHERLMVEIEKDALEGVYDHGMQINKSYI